MAHNRHPLFMKYGRIVAAITGGFSLEWWSPKHNMHHIFTNSKLYDEDIKHDYKVYLYEFLYLKWRFDSLIEAISNLNYVHDLINKGWIGFNFNQLHDHLIQLWKPVVLFLGKFVGRILLGLCAYWKPRKGTQIWWADQTLVHWPPSHHL